MLTRNEEKANSFYAWAQKGFEAYKEEVVRRTRILLAAGNYETAVCTDTIQRSFNSKVDVDEAVRRCFDDTRYY